MGPFGFLDDDGRGFTARNSTALSPLGFGTIAVWGSGEDASSVIILRAHDSPNKRSLAGGLPLGSGYIFVGTKTIYEISSILLGPENISAPPQYYSDCAPHSATLLGEIFGPESFHDMTLLSDRPSVVADFGPKSWEGATASWNFGPFVPKLRSLPAGTICRDNNGLPVEFEACPLFVVTHLLCCLFCHDGKEYRGQWGDAATEAKMRHAHRKIEGKEPIPQEGHNGKDGQ